MMRYFAIENSIRTGNKVPKNAVELTKDQYKNAIASMMAGQEVIVIDKELVIREKAPSKDHTWIDGEWVAPEPEPEDNTDVE